MKVSLNLLPEEKKRLVRRKRFDRFLFRQAFLFLSVVIFYLAVLGSVFFIVHESRTLIENGGTGYSADRTETERLALYESEFSRANDLAGRANRFQKAHPDWTGILLRMDGIVPPGVGLSSFSTKEYRTFLSGTAETRDDFLAFEEALKKEKCLSDFQIPVSNLFLEKNVDFQIDFTVNESCLMGNRPV